MTQFANSRSSLDFLLASAIMSGISAFRLFAFRLDHTFVFC